MNDRLFDRRAEWSVPVVGAGGRTKQCILRFPDDDELCDRSRKHRLVRRPVGRGITTDVPDVEKTEFELFQKLRADADGPEFDEYEAAEALEYLTDTEVIDSQPEDGGQLFVEMRVGCIFTVSHVLRLPARAVMTKFRRRSMTDVSYGNREEITISLEPGGEFYDACHVRHAGYAGAELSAIPIIHKHAAALQVRMHLDSLRSMLLPEVRGPAPDRA